MNGFGSASYVKRLYDEGSKDVKMKAYEGKGNFYEHAFVHNGYDCYVQLHDFTEGESTEVYIAFNNEENDSYYRKVRSL